MPRQVPSGSVHPPRAVDLCTTLAALSAACHSPGTIAGGTPSTRRTAGGAWPCRLVCCHCASVAIASPRGGARPTAAGPAAGTTLAAFGTLACGGEPASGERLASAGRLGIRVLNGLLCTGCARAAVFSAPMAATSVGLGSGCFVGSTGTARGAGTSTRAAFSLPLAGSSGAFCFCG